MQDQHTLILRKPIEFADQRYEKLELREPTAGELEKAGVASTSVGVVINLISAIAKVPRRVAEQLAQRDLGEATLFLSQFSEGSLETGATSSQS